MAVCPDFSLQMTMWPDAWQTSQGEHAYQRRRPLQCSIREFHTLQSLFWLSCMLCFLFTTENVVKPVTEASDDVRQPYGSRWHRTGPPATQSESRRNPSMLRWTAPRWEPQHLTQHHHRRQNEPPMTITLISVYPVLYHDRSHKGFSVCVMSSLCPVWICLTQHCPSHLTDHVGSP